MRIILFANGAVGLAVAQYLDASPHDEIVGLVVHPPETQRLTEEIIATCGLAPERVFAAEAAQELRFAETVRALDAEVGVSIIFGYLLPEPVFSAFPRGCVNLHPSLLPWNRGSHANVWPIVEGTPAGVTLHLIDAGIDTGAILAQQEVPIGLTDTGAALYAKLERACIELFEKAWPRFREGTLEPTPQPRGGTFHRDRDLRALDRIELDGMYRARDLINLIRARTFPPFDGAFMEEDGRRVHLRLELHEPRAVDAETKRGAS